MKPTVAKQEDGTITITVTIPTNEVTKATEKEIEEVVKNTDLAGFRKGKAPRKLVEEKINKEKLKEDVLKKLLPAAYMQALQELNLKPVISPQIHVDKLDDGKDWVFSATTCEAPEIILKGYKDAIQKITAKSKIILPGKENEKQEPKLDDIVEALLAHIKISIPKVLIDREVERLLAQLLDEIKSLGLSLDQYVSSTHKTIEQIKEDYAKKAENDIKFEFALQKIAEEENLVVEPQEVDEAILKATDPKEKENLERNKYLLASILRQQKTLDFLKNL
ncbi:MAG TPA: trigger factor [Candidatus Saccharimonadales bacterium]|nr:trigger factor [Candidatus Saccharimonadales bacterium]